MTRASALHFVHAALDFLVIGGASLITYCALRTFGDGSRSSSIIRTAYFLLWLCNWPHFAATNYRLYQSRDNILQYPLTALGLPWLVLAGVVACFVFPASVAPVFVHFFLIWSPYHFSGQSVGITMLYARRAAFKIGRLERFFLSGFVFGTFIFSTLRSETSLQGGTYYGISYPGLGVPSWVPDAVWCVMGCSGAAFLLLAAGPCWQSRRLLPAIVLVPAVAQFVWFILGSGVPAFNEFVPFFHSLQYLLIAWAMQLKTKLDRERLKPSWEYVAFETTRWGCLNWFLGAGLFFGIPRVLYGLGFPLEFSTGVISAAVQIHHFFVDGVIWKLKDKSVSSPLMVSLDDLVHGDAAAA